MHAVAIAAGSAAPEIDAGSTPYVADPEHAARIAQTQEVQMGRTARGSHMSLV